MEKTYWQDFSYVIRGKQKQKIIISMDKPMTVTEIKKKTFLSLAEASRVLRGFAKRKIAVCVNPKDVMGRVYKLTARGQKLKKEFIKRQKSP
jgi:DNA-binding transcriptional regulator GbsR (MarR family)